MFYREQAAWSGLQAGEAGEFDGCFRNVFHSYVEDQLPEKVNETWAIFQVKPKSLALLFSYVFLISSP